MCNMYQIIEDLCGSKGITVGKMCADLTISRGTLGDLNKGRTQKLSAGTMEKIAAYFGVSIDYLLGKENAPADGEDVLQNLKDEERILLHSYRTMTEQQKQMVAVFLKGLKDIEGE